MTTKTEILDWFGQPALIMKPGDEHPDYTSEDVPPSASPYFFSFGGMTHRNLDNIFELFTGSHDIRDNHRIYMYTYSRSGGGMLAVPFFSTYGTDMRTDCLLILLDEHTSIVLDYLMDRQK
ncbi:MAG: hypothetical protein KAS72_11765 [Phycisphaerales bacterium]|nr:hypothetical protein [Phycisphaerales bacterium]